MFNIKKLVLACLIALMSLIVISGTLQNSKITKAQAGSISSAPQSAIKVEREAESSVAHGLMERVEISWPWYLTRASGLVAAASFVILMLSGIGLVTGHTFSFWEPLTAWASHRALGITFSVAVLLHIFSLYFDNFVPFSFVSLLVPFTSSYKTTQLFGYSVGSLWVALGVLSLYITIAIMGTSLLWIEKKPKLWKFTHILSYVGMIFVFIHSLYLGTDLAHGLLRWLWILGALTVLYASLARLWRVKTL
jgi:predicted ferric reductase